MNKLVRDFMHPGLITCEPGATLGEVAVILFQNHVHALFVTAPDGQIQGVITDFDLLAGEWLSADEESLNAMRRMTAGELMSSPVGSIDASTPVSEAAHRMQSEVIRRLLVTENGKPVGVLSVSDFIASVAEEAQTERRTVGDVMSDVYLTCRENTPVASAARSMADTGWRSVLVVSARGKPLGLFSGLDLLKLADDVDFTAETVSQVMHSVLTIGQEATLREAASMMIENHHHRLVVVDPEHPDTMPLGIISSFDIVAQMARPDSVWQQ